ncbi:MAG: GDP-mannose 4,6-dehydratase [Abitibacteriaceae bacterium]|nr:GDP-mannose 4,6-dehydratase [Abditibacteriaceae bacterium]
MKVLVTGGAGFIGSFLVDRLVTEGHAVTSIDSLEAQVHNSGKPDYLNDNCTYLWGSCSDANLIATALEGIEVVFHLAAIVGVAQSMYEVVRYTQGNTLGTAVLLEQMIKMQKRPQKIIVASSMSIYGEGTYQDEEGHEVYAELRPASQLKMKVWEVLHSKTKAPMRPLPTSETKPLKPGSIYAIGKRDHEEMVHVIGQAYNIPSVACRFFNAYGSRQALSNPYTGVAAIFCSRLLKGLPPVIFEDGQQLRDFVHVSDLIEGLLLCLHKETANYQTFNLGSGLPISIEQVATALSKAITDGKIAPVISQEFRAGDIRHCFADINKARELLNYNPKYSFAVGIPELVQWVSRQQSEVDKGTDRFDTALHEAKQRGLIS